MELTNEVLARFIGGDIEIQNQGEKYLYRGPIKEAKVENGELKVEVDWLAKGEGYPPLPVKWVKDDKTTYGASLEIYSVSEGELGRVLLHSNIVGEMVVFYPPDGSKLDPKKVEGLE